MVKLLGELEPSRGSIPRGWAEAGNEPPSLLYGRAKVISTLKGEHQFGTVPRSLATARFAPRFMYREVWPTVVGAQLWAN